MIKKRAFTLIELLVVIAIIAMLLAILMPSLKAAKKVAQAVVCKTNLHQWGLCYSLYTNDWEGNFPEYLSGTLSVSYMESLRDYYADANKLRTCPTASKYSPDNPTGLEPKSFFGNTFHAWQIDPSASWLRNTDWGLGSYTENSWIRSRRGGNPKEWNKISSIKITSEVPLLLDGRWHDSHIENEVPSIAANEKAFYSLSNWWTVRSFVMRRHKDGINGVMADMSTINIKAEDIWTLKWHREFEKKADVDLSWLKSSL